VKAAPNKRPALDADMTPSLQFEGHWRGASEAERSAASDAMSKSPRLQRGPV